VKLTNSLCINDVFDGIYDIILPLNTSLPADRCRTRRSYCISPSRCYCLAWKGLFKHVTLLVIYITLLVIYITLLVIYITLLVMYITLLVIYI